MLFLVHRRQLTCVVPVITATKSMRHCNNHQSGLQGDRKAEKDSPSRPAAPRELAPAATNCQHPDLCALSSHILSETQSQSQKPFKVSLNWAKLGLAATLEGMATAHSTAQQSGKVWPVKADGKEPTVMHYNVNSLYQLGECPSGAAVCTFEVRGFGGDESGVAGNEVVGAKDDAEAAEHNVTLSEGTFVLAKEDCLIFSESCSSLQLSMITFQGMFFLEVVMLFHFAVWSFGEC